MTPSSRTVRRLIRNPAISHQEGDDLGPGLWLCCTERWLVSFTKMKTMKTQTSILFEILTFMVRPRRLFWLTTRWWSFLPPLQHSGFVFQGLLLLIQSSVCSIPAADFRVLAGVQLALRLTYAPAQPPCQFLTCSQLIKASIFLRLYYSFNIFFPSCPGPAPTGSYIPGRGRWVRNVRQNKQRSKRNTEM